MASKRDPLPFEHDDPHLGKPPLNPPEEYLAAIVDCVEELLNASRDAAASARITAPLLEAKHEMEALALLDCDGKSVDIREAQATAALKTNPAYQATLLQLLTEEEKHAIAVARKARAQVMIDALKIAMQYRIAELGGVHSRG